MLGQDCQKLDRYATSAGTEMLKTRDSMRLEMCRKQWEESYWGGGWRMADGLVLRWGCGSSVSCAKKVGVLDIFSASELRLSLLIWFRARSASMAIFSFLAFRYISMS